MPFNPPFLWRVPNQELESREGLDRFVRAQPDNVLTVVNVSSNETPCVRVFAAVLALAKSFQGYAAFGRLMYDESEEARAIARELNVLQVRACACMRAL